MVCWPVSPYNTSICFFSDVCERVDLKFGEDLQVDLLFLFLLFFLPSSFNFSFSSEFEFIHIHKAKQHIGTWAVLRGPTPQGEGPNQRKRFTPLMGFFPSQRIKKRTEPEMNCRRSPLGIATHKD
jgi:hypothetical protein